MFYLKLVLYYHSASKNPKLTQFHNLKAAKSLVVMEIKQVHGVKTIQNCFGIAINDTILLTKPPPDI